MIELTDGQIFMVMTRLRDEHGSLQAAYIALAARIEPGASINRLAAMVGCSRATVRAHLQKAGQRVADSAS